MSGLAVMSVDLGAEWMKIAVVSVGLSNCSQKSIFPPLKLNFIFKVYDPAWKKYL